MLHSPFTQLHTVFYVQLPSVLSTTRCSGEQAQKPIIKRSCEIIRLQINMHHSNSGNTHNPTKYETPEKNKAIGFAIAEIKETSSHMYINHTYCTGQVVRNLVFTNKVVCF